MENTKLIEGVVENTNPKEETEVQLTGNTPDFITRFNSPLKLDEDKPYSVVRGSGTWGSESPASRATLSRLPDLCV